MPSPFTIGLSFVSAFSIVIGFELLHTFVKQISIKKSCNLCLISLIIWGISFEIIPFIIYFIDNKNNITLILGYSLSLLFMTLLYCTRLYKQLKHTNVTDLSTLQPSLQPSIDLNQVKDKACINLVQDTKKNSIDIIMDSKTLKVHYKQGAIYWILCLNTNNHKPIGYMSCNNDGYCYNNCIDTNQSKFEIVCKSDYESNTNINANVDKLFDIISYWKNTNNDNSVCKCITVKQKICMKEQGHWSGYVGMWHNNDNIAWKFIPADTLAENGYKIQYIINGTVNGWLGYCKESKWLKICKQEEDAGVYILGRH
eukprot:426799_1